MPELGPAPDKPLPETREPTSGLAGPLPFGMIFVLLLGIVLAAIVFVVAQTMG